MKELPHDAPNHQFDAKRYQFDAKAFNPPLVDLKYIMWEITLPCVGMKSAG